MKPRTGDDEESGRIKLGSHAFSNDTPAGEGLAGGFSRAIKGARSFGGLVLSNARQSVPGVGGYPTGGRGRGPRGPIP